MSMVSVRAARITPAAFQNLLIALAALALGGLFAAAFPDIVTASVTWLRETAAPVVAQVASLPDRVAAVVAPPFEWLVTR